MKPSGSIIGRFWLPALGLAVLVLGVYLAARANQPLVLSNSVEVGPSELIATPPDAWVTATWATAPFRVPVVIALAGALIFVGGVAYQLGRSRQARTP